MTDNAAEEIASQAEDRFVARLQVKPPPFYRKSPELWFKQMESQFFLAGIQSSITKYHHAMAALPEEVMSNITDNSPTCDYEALKAAVLESLKANRFQLIEEAMSAIELGDRKPSHLVNEIQRRFSEVGVKVDDTIVKSRLLSALPPQIRSALVGHEDADLKTFSKIADSMLAVLPAATPFRVQHTARAPEATTSSPQQQRYQQLQPASVPHQQSYGGPRPFYANQRQKVCNSHIFYGTRARTCRPWCQWPGNKPRVLHPGPAGVMEFDRNLFNVVMLGISFLFLFSAFQTTSMAEESVLLGEKNITNGNFTGDGYVSLSIIYFSFAASNWVAPVIVYALGPRFSMFISAIIYDLFIASFLIPRTALLYAGSALLGIAAAVIWTAQGAYLAQNSTPNTAGRNSGIFWALLQSSLIVGNLFLMIELKGQAQILEAVRTRLFLVFTACGIIGAVCFVLLRKPLSVTEQVLGEDSDEPRESQNFESSVGQQQRSVWRENWDVFVYSFKLAATKKVLLLMPLFGYTGFELTFFSGVFGTCLGNMGQFGSSSKSYIGLAGLFIGAGEITGGLAFSIFDKLARRCGRQGVVAFGFCVHVVSFFLAFLIIPNAAPMHSTPAFAYIGGNVYVAMVAAYLLGLGDSSCNTQIFSYLSDKYKKDSASAFALFKFMQSLCAAVAFFYSNHLFLQWQLLILVVSGLLGTVGFILVNALSDIPPGYERVIQAE